MITATYNLFIRVYSFAIKLASLWNPKAKKWTEGRKKFFERLKYSLNNLPNDNGGSVIWMHCASLGEFEQGRPVIEKLKAQHATARIFITFFSPSGYEIRKDYAGADLVCYLPLDTAANARRFIQHIKPTLVLWIRYELWLHYLKELRKANIPLLLLSATVYRSNSFYRPFRKKLYQYFSHLFVQDQPSLTQLEKEGLAGNATLAGDTRFDRVIKIAESFQPIPEVEAFCNSHKVVVAGSTWMEDEEVLIHYTRVNPLMRFIIAPHEVDSENIKNVQKEFPNSILFSAWRSQYQTENPANKAADEGSIVNTLIIDNIGMLSRLYHYADVTYVGGGFGDTGLHNILEAAVYGKPVFFGPVFHRNYEAEKMIEAGGAFSIENALELEKELNNLMNDNNVLKKSGESARAFIYSNAGATQRILDYIYKKRLLTN
ncbi:MAG: 3-deoxy-D-manno-octulosonic acid transferase [Chitinophagaceae bacterium]|nr:3-deoxy-D-manno-octulosonic acid transferase [Chitinophagaceae bacterium]